MWIRCHLFYEINADGASTVYVTISEKTRHMGFFVLCMVDKEQSHGDGSAFSSSLSSPVKNCSLCLTE